MRVLFIGSTKRGYYTINSLLERTDVSIVGIFSLRQDKHEIERYEELIKQLAERFNIPCFEINTFKEKDYSKIIRQLNPDIALVVGCRVLIPHEIFSIPVKGTLAVHDSLLPNYRGFAPLNWSIINSENKTGVTLFFLDKRMDGGDIVGQKEVKIGPDSTAPEIYDAICESTAELIIEFLPALAKGSVIKIPQNYFSGSFCCSRTPSDGLIDWFDTSYNIYNLIRALTFPYPGAYTYYEGEKLIILKADIIENPPNYIGRIPGRVIGFSTEDGWVDVLTGDGILRIKEVQKINQEKTQAATVIRSIKKSLGLSMQFLMDKISELEKRIVELITNQKNPY